MKRVHYALALGAARAAVYENCDPKSFTGLSIMEQACLVVAYVQSHVVTYYHGEWLRVSVVSTVQDVLGIQNYNRARDIAAMIARVVIVKGNGHAGRYRRSRFVFHRGSYLDDLMREALNHKVREAQNAHQNWP